MKHLSEYIAEHAAKLSSLIVEGGNAVTAQPIPAYITPVLYEEIEKRFHKEYPSVKMAPLGSMGKKKDDDFNGDIDIAVDIKDRNDLLNAVNKVFPGYEVNPMTTSQIVSISYPYDREGKKGEAQVDFMMVHDIEWAKWRYQSPDYRNGESKYKSKLRADLIRACVSAIPVAEAKDEYFEDGTTVKRHWKYTFNTEGVFLQLLDYTGKKGPLKNPKRLKEFEKLVHNDPVNVMKFVFGDDYDESAFRSAEGMWKALHDPKQYKFGPEAVAKAEELFYRECIEDPKYPCPGKPEDFPCRYYVPEQVSEHLVTRKTSGEMLKHFPQSYSELRKLIMNRIAAEGNDCNLNDIDVSGVKDFSFLFGSSLNEFNGDISKWDVSNAVNMARMFENSKFNGDISKWDVSNCMNFSNMFHASKFAGDLSEWDIRDGANVKHMLKGCETLNDKEKLPNGRSADELA